MVEVDGSTIEAAWHPVAAVVDGSLPTVSLVKEALDGYRPHPFQRVAAYALITRGGPDPAVLLTRISAQGFHTGLWSLPGGGVEQGEAPVDALVREVQEETGLDAVVGELLTVGDVALHGTAPSGRDEEFHSIGIVYAADVPSGSEATLVEQDGTTDAVAWVPLSQIEDETVEVLDLVRDALADRPQVGQRS